MNVYQQTPTGVYRRTDCLQIPADPNNRHYQEYLRYVKQGGATDPMEEPGDTLAIQIEAIEAERYKRETASLIYEGKRIPYDRESRTILDSTLDKIRRGVIPEIYWKCEDGRLLLTPSNIDALELLGVQQIKNAFEWEATELAKLGV